MAEEQETTPPAAATEEVKAPVSIFAAAPVAPKTEDDAEKPAAPAKEEESTAQFTPVVRLTIFLSIEVKSIILVEFCVHRRLDL
jgi:hypothetical protein